MWYACNIFWLFPDYLRLKQYLVLYNRSVVANHVDIFAGLSVWVGRELTHCDGVSHGCYHLDVTRTQLMDCNTVPNLTHGLLYKITELNRYVLQYMY